MIREEMREKILSAWGAPEHDDIMPKRADVAIALVLEEAAKVAEASWCAENVMYYSENDERNARVTAYEAAAAIRALKPSAR